VKRSAQDCLRSHQSNIGRVHVRECEGSSRVTGLPFFLSTRNTETTSSLLTRMSFLMDRMRRRESSEWRIIPCKCPVQERCRGSEGPGGQSQLTWRFQVLSGDPALGRRQSTLKPYTMRHHPKG